MYRKLYEQASSAADQIIGGNYQRRKPRELNLVNRPSNKSEMQVTSLDEPEDFMMDYFTAVRKENLALKELLAEQTPDLSFSDPPNTAGPAPEGSGKGYDMPQKEIEGIIRSEAKIRGIDPEIAVRIFRSEGAGAYQSQIERSGKGSAGGKEASYGPFQLYTGGGLGNKYEAATGRQLTKDNTTDGIVQQIRFSLDAAVDSGWAPWYGRKHAGVGVWDGLSNAKKVGNWK